MKETIMRGKSSLLVEMSRQYQICTNYIYSMIKLLSCYINIGFQFLTKDKNCLITLKISDKRLCMSCH